MGLIALRLVAGMDKFYGGMGRFSNMAKMFPRINHFTTVE